MRLYTNTKAEWFGTQADAKASGHKWWEVNVPTDKPNLIKFLNGMSEAAGAVQILRSDDAAPAPAPAPASTYSTSLHKAHPWQTIRECAETAPLKDWGVALAVLMNRVEEIADKESV